jgi:hypothetical protein
MSLFRAYNLVTVLQLLLVLIQQVLIVPLVMLTVVRNYDGIPQFAERFPKIDSHCGSMPPCPE